MVKEKVSTVEEFQNTIDDASKVLFIKHSTTCPISQAAYEEYEKFTEDFTVDSLYLYVQEARTLSNFIAETYDVKHESPQALLFYNGKVVWHDSHWNITYDQLQTVAEKFDILKK